jgi:tetratricopeptide (TPR) repeat protein
MRGIFGLLVIALIILMPCITAQDTTAIAWLQKGDEFYKNNSYDLALRCYDKAIEIDQFNPDSWNDKAKILTKLGRNTEADTASAKAKELGYSGSSPLEMPDEVLEQTSDADVSIMENITQNENSPETSVINDSNTFIYRSNDISGRNQFEIIKVHFKNVFRGADQDIAVVDRIWQVSDIDSNKVLVNDSDNVIITSGTPLTLEEGYELAIKSTDISVNKADLELSKNGEAIYSVVITPPQTTDSLYTYSTDIGSVENAKIIEVHFKNAVRGADQDMATVDRIWQASDNNPSQVLRNDSNEVIITSSSPLTLEEGYELGLKSIDISGVKSYVELSKNGKVIDSMIIVSPQNMSEIPVIDSSIVLLFDASNSMSGKKMKNAKIAVNEFISELDLKSNEIALIVFYDCDDIKIVQPFTTEEYKISSKIDSIQPTGETPISAAIDFSKYYIDQNANGMTKKIILFTDGEETCPFKATYSGTDDVDVSIVGFDIHKDSSQEKKLIELAKKVNGNYFNAEDASTPDALASSLRQAYVGLNIKNNFDAAMVWVNKGNALFNQDKFEKAIEAYDEAIKLDPENAPAWLAKGLALGELERYYEAIEAYDEVLKLDPENAPAWNNKGVIFGEQDKDNEAIEAYDKAIKLDPNDALYWTNLGQVLNRQGKYTKAIEAFNKAIRLDPEDANAWSGKGYALSELGRYDDSIDAYDEAIRLDPNRA